MYGDGRGGVDCSEDLGKGAGIWGEDGSSGGVALMGGMVGGGRADGSGVVGGAA